MLLPPLLLLLLPLLLLLSSMPALVQFSLVPNSNFGPIFLFLFPFCSSPLNTFFIPNEFNWIEISRLLFETRFCLYSKFCWVRSHFDSIPHCAMCSQRSFGLFYFFSHRDVGLFLLAVEHVLLCYVFIHISLPFSFSLLLVHSLIRK